MPRQIAIVLPSTATFCSLTLGVLAIIALLGEGNFVLAMVLIGIGSILDVCDGALANRLNAITAMGKELDSLADVITFGVAPTILIYRLLLIVGVYTPLAVLVSLIFVWGGAFRLARYNTLPCNRSADFIGLPIPAASLLLIAGGFWQHWVIQVWWTVAVVLVSYLMVSPFPYPKLYRVKHLPPLMWALALLVIAVFWLLAGWQAVPFALLAVYALAGPVQWIYGSTRRRAALR